MNELENLQPQGNSPFVAKVIEWFQSLMDKFTNGKYSSEDEKKFFSDESKLYDASGKPTDEYCKKIAEFEKFVCENQVNTFLKDIHSENSPLGRPYTTAEHQMLDSACSFIDHQNEIVKELIDAKNEAFVYDRLFDFDDWFKEYAIRHDIAQEHIDAAKNEFIDMIDDLLKNDPELCQVIKDSFTKN